jgi:hypothetical protein
VVFSVVSLALAQVPNGAGKLSQRWEYKVVDFNTTNPAEIEETLNGVAKDGWELDKIAGATSRLYVFRRFEKRL